MFSYRNLDTFSTAGGSIEKSSVSLTPSQHLAIYRGLIKLDTSRSIEVSIEVTGFQISKSDFWARLLYLCRVSFLTTLDLYKAYFRGRHIRENKIIQGEHMQKVTDVLFSLKEVTTSLRFKVL